MSNNFPSIGEIVLDPSDKFKENGADKFDLLLCDGSAVNQLTHPELFYKTETNSIFYSGNNTVLQDMQFPMDLCFDGVFFWVVDYTAESVFKFDSNLTYTGFNFQVGQQLTEPTSICFVNGELLVTGFDATHQKYTTSGSAVGAPVTTPNGSSMRGSASFNDKIYISGRISGVEQIIIYDADINQIGSIMIANARGLCKLYNEIAIVSSDEIIMYDADFQQTGRTLYIGTQTGSNAFGIEHSTSGRLFVSDINGVFEYESRRLAPNIPPKTPETPYKIVADLTED